MTSLATAIICAAILYSVQISSQQESVEIVTLLNFMHGAMIAIGIFNGCVALGHVGMAIKKISGDEDDKTQTKTGQPENPDTTQSN